MPTHPVIRSRATVLAIVVACVLLMGGCSGETGPSADKARLDLDDRLKQSSRGTIMLDDFRVTERRVLSEDRVKLHIRTGLKKDEARMRQIKQRNRMMGGWSPALEQAEKIDDGRGQATLIYKRTSGDVWQLYRVQMGYQ